MVKWKLWEISSIRLVQQDVNNLTHKSRVLNAAPIELKDFLALLKRPTFFCTKLNLPQLSPFLIFFHHHLFPHHQLAAFLVCVRMQKQLFPLSLIDWNAKACIHPYISVFPRSPKSWPLANSVVQLMRVAALPRVFILMDKPDESGKSRDSHKKKAGKELENANENFKCLRSVGKMFLYHGGKCGGNFRVHEMDLFTQHFDVVILLQHKVYKGIISRYIYQAKFKNFVNLNFYVNVMALESFLKKKRFMKIRNGI